MLGNEEDFSAALGYQVPGMDEHHSTFEVDGFKQMISKVVKDYPFGVVATTLRKAETATQNDWGAISYCDGKFYQAKNRENLEIFDRVGGGDSLCFRPDLWFPAGKDPQWAVECGAAHGALAMTTPGDTSMATFRKSSGDGRRRARIAR
jgi:2-dehydro-3-deoxygluconokinase